MDNEEEIEDTSAGEYFFCTACKKVHHLNDPKCKAE